MATRLGSGVSCVSGVGLLDGLAVNVVGPSVGLNVGLYDGLCVGVIGLDVGS